MHLEKAVEGALDAGYRTGDLYSEGCKQVGCKEMGQVLAGFIPSLQPAGR